jgi:hypothetical protein
MSTTKSGHSAVFLKEFGGKVGRVEMEDCVLETMTGCCTFIVSLGAAYAPACCVAGDLAQHRIPCWICCE